jgi:hypothetical protein
MEKLLADVLLKEMRLLSEVDDPLGLTPIKKTFEPPSQDDVREFLKTRQDFENRPQRYMSTEGFSFN